MEWKPIKDYPKKWNRKDRVLLYKPDSEGTQEFMYHSIVAGDMVRIMIDATHFIIIENPDMEVK